jgi:hypothetical protein
VANISSNTFNGKGEDVEAHVSGMLDKFAAQVEALDEVAHVVLKGHLLIEEWLTRAIAQHLFHPEHVNDDGRLSFSQKTALARSLGLRKNTSGMWELIAAVNGLRNELAHSLDSPRRLKKLEKLKAIYFRETHGLQDSEQMKNWPDALLVRRVCALCLGFLSSFAQDSFQLRKLIHEIDRNLNPQLPEIQLILP